MTESTRPAGYRGALPPREDRLATVWVVTIFAILVLIFVLAIAGIPSRFASGPTPIPVPSTTIGPSGSEAPSPSGEPEPRPS
jgi:hypothetical protein